MGAAVVAAWMPITLTIASTSMISPAVAPSRTAFCMCSLSPGTYRWVAEASNAM